VAVDQWKEDCKALGLSNDVIEKTLATWKEARAKHMANVK